MGRGGLYYITTYLTIIILITTALVTAQEFEISEEGHREAEEDPFSNPTEAVEGIPGATFEEDVYGFSDTEGDHQISSISQDTSVQFNEGKVSQFNINNALISFGSLVQGSFISFNNNNNILFGSLFDASKFKATVDEGGRVDVKQRGTFGDTGKVHITLDNANLTQDEAITFMPDGDTPTYIYHNTTEIEFEDGILELLGEIITNLDTTRETTTVSFNENGFTRIQLLPQNSYTSFDYSITNINNQGLIICKNDPLCDINIVGAIFTIKGLASFDFKGDTVYRALDPNNIATINVDTGEFTITNTNVKNTLVSEVYTGNHKITETKDGIFDLPVRDSSPSIIQSYNSGLHNTEFTLEDNTITLDRFKSIIFGKIRGACLANVFC